MKHIYTIYRKAVLILTTISILFIASCKVTETESKYHYRGTSYIRYKNGKIIRPEGEVKVSDSKRYPDNVHTFRSDSIQSWSDGKRDFHRVSRRILAPMIDSGKINMYCIKDDSYLYSHTAGVPNSGGWAKVSSSTFYIETGKDTLKEIKYKLLNAKIPHSSPSYNTLLQYRKINQYTQTTTYGGVALILAGLLMASEKGTPFHYQFGESPLKPVQVTGWGLVAGGSVSIHIGNRYRKNNKVRLINAVRQYNAE